MSYLPPSSGPPIDRDTLRTLGGIVGLDIPDEDLEALGIALRDQLASVRQLEKLHLTDVSPDTTFDPRWDD